MESFFREAFSEKNFIFSIFLLTGAIEWLVLYFIYRYRQRMIEGGQETTGRVVDIVSRSGFKSRSSYPVFQFRTYFNEEITCRSTISSQPSPYKTGEEVTIIYNPQKPKQFIVRGDKRFRFMLFVMGTMATAFFLIGLFGLLTVLRSYF